jgi:hypothetical protein
MWDDLLNKLKKYPSAVLTAMDSNGYPFSIRCVPEPDSSTQTLKLPLPDYVDLKPGPAGLLCHYHDDQLWNQTNFVARGMLTQESGQWIFKVSTIIEGAGAGMSLIRQLRHGRRTAKRYLEKRGLSRPKIPWAELAAIYKRAQQKP